MEPIFNTEQEAKDFADGFVGAQGIHSYCPQWGDMVRTPKGVGQVAITEEGKCWINYYSDDIEDGFLSFDNIKLLILPEERKAALKAMGLKERP